MDSAAHEQELAALKTRLAATESAIQDLNTANEVTVTEVKHLQMDSAAHEQELAALKTGLAATETAVENLENEIKSAPKVAFSAGLGSGGYLNAGNKDLNLVFRNVITNVGQAYSSTSGFFTVPVRGVYYFRFTVMDYLSSHHMEIKMDKNGHELMWLWEYDTNGQAAHLSSGLTLQLEKGDAVNLRIPANRRLYDTVNDCTFSGILLFPL
ncbi:cerebellin-3-like [Engraulis encrasicolus]|uniref:cerebellin-3-like n=1 Tax=Engraulis encrasicolus TaxID=184585 RepID=UPI002FD25D5B